MRMTFRGARVNAGLTQPELAEILGVTEQTVRSWEAGATEPKISQFRDFCKAVGVSIECIFFD